MVRPSEQVTNRSPLFLCTRFLYQKQVLFWKKKKKRQWLLESNRRRSSLMSGHGFNLSRTPPWIQDPRISLQTQWCPAEHHPVVVTHGASFHTSEVPPFFPPRSGAHCCKLHIPWNKLGDSKMYFGIFLCWHSTWNMEVSMPVTYRTLVWYYPCCHWRKGAAEGSLTPLLYALSSLVFFYPVLVLFHCCLFWEVYQHPGDRETRRHLSDSLPFVSAFPWVAWALALVY